MKKFRILIIIALVLLLATLLYSWWGGFSGVGPKQRRQLSEAESNAQAAVVQHFQDKYGIDVEVVNIIISVITDGSPIAPRRVTHVFKSGHVWVSHDGIEYLAFYDAYKGENGIVYDSYQSDAIKQSIVDLIVETLDLPGPLRFEIKATESVSSYGLRGPLLVHDYFDGTNIQQFIWQCDPAIALYYPDGILFPSGLSSRAEVLMDELGIFGQDFTILVEKEDEVETIYPG